MAHGAMLATAEDYRHCAQKKSNAHYRMTERAKARHNSLGIPVTVSTAIVNSYRIVSVYEPDLGLDPPYVSLCESCGWSSHEDPTA